MEITAKMIKRLNSAILDYLKGIRLRSVGATILGGFAGLSLNANIIPSALTYGGITDSFSARWALGGYAVYSVMLWSVGGWSAQRSGCKKFGALVMGLVGLVSGLLLTGFGVSTQFQALLYGGGAAMLYGAIGGMIIADALREPTQQQPSVRVEQGSMAKKRVPTQSRRDARRERSAVRWFRFFK